MALPKVPVDPALSAFIVSAVTDWTAPLTVEALAIVRAAGGFGVGLDVMAEAATTGALAALARLGYVPTSTDSLEALRGASDTLSVARRAIIKDKIALDEKHLERKRAFDGLMWRDEPLERLKAELAPEYAAIRQRDDTLRAAEGARDCASSAFGFMGYAKDVTDPDHVAHWACQSAKSAGNALWFSSQTAPDETAAAFRTVLEAVPQLGG